MENFKLALSNILIHDLKYTMHTKYTILCEIFLIWFYLRLVCCEVCEKIFFMEQQHLVGQGLLFT
jgi:hypothetical protein